MGVEEEVEVEEEEVEVEEEEEVEEEVEVEEEEEVEVEEEEEVEVEEEEEDAELTADEEEQAMKIFNMLDTDGNEFVTSDELVLLHSEAQKEAFIAWVDENAEYMGSPDEWKEHLARCKTDLADDERFADHLTALAENLTPVTEEAGAGALNQAYVFIKPHAVTDAVKALVSKGLADQGVTIVSEGSIASEDIDSKKLIDQHYYAIASKATILQPHQLNVPQDKFEEQFGVAASAVREDSDDSDEEGADFQMGAEGQGAL